MERLAGPTQLLPNAADQAAVEVDRSLGESWRAKLGLSGRPVAGFLGTVDWRFDASTMTECARALPEVDFVVAGRVNADRESAVRDLRQMSNVKFSGQLGYDDGYAVNHLFDVGLVPFTPGPMNDCINSVKTFMYLITGKPVVSTKVRESLNNPHVTVAEDGASMAAAIKRELAEDDDRRRETRRAFGFANTWDARADQAWGLLSDAGLT
jgi:glycosyltransferase involved in cell wall biosynthesis